jgi:cholesterol oxidase
MLGVVRYPYLPTDVDRYMRTVATEMGRGETFNQAPVGLWFGRPGVEADDPYFGGAGPRRTGCISCGNCNNGCGQGAKNKLTTNYLYLAKKSGVQVHELHEVYELAPLDGGGFEVRTRHPGWVSARRVCTTAPGPPVRSSWPRTPTAQRSSCIICSTRAA